MQRYKVIALSTSGVVVSLLVLATLMAARVPSGADALATKTRIQLIAADIREYAGQEHRLPGKLSDLRTVLGASSMTGRDAWGSEMRYSPSGGTSVTLASRGPDGVWDSPDDIVVTFEVAIPQPRPDTHGVRE